MLNLLNHDPALPHFWTEYNDATGLYGNELIESLCDLPWRILNRAELILPEF